MSADEVYLWLLPVMAFSAFLLGGYLLVSGRQAKAAGEGSHKVKFLGVEIESSTSGTTLIMLAIVVVVVVISLGIGRATDTGNGADDPTDPTTTPTTTGSATGSTGGHTSTGSQASGLTKEQNVITPGDLDRATTGINVTGWAEVAKEHRPTLDCLRQRLADFDGFVGPVAARNFTASDGGPESNAMSTVARFSDDDAAEDVFDDVREWLQTCPSGLEGNRPFRADRAADRQDFTDRPVSWRNFWLPDDVCQCIWVNSQAVGRNGDLIVLLSVDWRQAQVPSDTLGPIPESMPRALDLADD